MARKGQFKKGGGRHGSRARSRTTAIVVQAPRSTTRRRSTRRHHTKHRRRRGHASITNRIIPIAATAAVMSYALSSQGSAALKTAVDKIPGAKTFGAPAALGVACLAIDKFVKPNKYLKLAGIAGIVLAAAKIGEQGTNFKWLGDDDVGDYDLSDDIEGDDDMGDVGDDE